jgi:hypothetical protein
MRLDRQQRAIRCGSLAMLIAISARAQTPTQVPWTVGENLEYTVKLEGLPRGTALLQVLPQDTIQCQRDGSRRSC